MEQYAEKVSAIYHDKNLAQQALEKLRQNGFSEDQLRIIGPHDPLTGTKLEPEGEGMARHIIKDTLIGGGIGGALGAAGSAAMGAAQIALFVTNPIMGSLVITGYAAAVGSIVGAVKGVKIKETAYLGVVEDALKKGHWVVAVHAHDKEEEKKAHGIIAETVVDREVGT